VGAEVWVPEGDKTFCKYERFYINISFCLDICSCNLLCHEREYQCS